MLARTGKGRRERATVGLAALAGVIAIGAAVGALGVLPGSDSGTEATGAAPPEPRLDGATPPRASAREKGRGEAGGRRPTVVQVVPPGGSAQERNTGDEEPPERIQKENAKLRRELDHLKALEAERRRVSRTLIHAGAVYDGPVRLGPGGLAWPVNGAVVSPFGQRWGRLHAGVDIAARAGTVIHAAQDGLVVIAGPTGGYGNYVCVQHTTRLTTCYAHLSRFGTRRGELVHQGDPLGLVGCTGHCFGDHLHFETWVGGKPTDPMRYF
jgi:murein DD-endopeptidase MepM/ murein hydrolase activator NlpD